MQRLKLSLIGCLFAVTTILLSASDAQGIEKELFRLMMDSSRNEFVVKGDLKGTAYFRSDVDRQDSDLNYFQYEGHAIARVHEGDDDEWFVHGNLKTLTFDSNLRMPRAKAALPEDLWDFDIGGTYRRDIGNNWQTGATVRVGSNADEPFQSIDELSVKARWWLRMPHLESNAFLVYLNFNNDIYGTFGKIPMPAFNYIWIPNGKVQVIAGFPIMGVRAEPILEKLEISVFYALTRTLKADITYKPTDWIDIYSKYDWGTDYYRRADREDFGERISFHKKEAKLGIKFHVGEKFVVDAFGGWAFDRFMYEGEGHEDRDDDRISIDDGAFAGVALKWKF